MIVDDNAINRNLVEKMLKHMEIESDFACDGAEAVETLANADYDAVLMDCQMSVLDGFGATQKVRTRESESRHTTIIALTANALIKDRSRCIEAGMDDYLAKPVRLEDLREMLGRWLG